MPNKTCRVHEVRALPIVEQPLVGDFNALGYRYILYKILENASPSADKCETWRKQNKDVVRSLEAATLHEGERLKQALTGL